VRPGSRPSIRAFLQYAVSGMPAQGQQGNVPLNAARAPGAPALQSVLPEAGAAELAALLRRAMLRLVDDFASPDSGDVDYEHMQDSPQWGTFLAVASELASDRLWADLLASSTAQRKAFFINLYNAMTFHGILAFGRRPGLWNLYCFFIAPAVSYLVAGVPLSLDDVENGLLRAQPRYFQGSGRELLRKLQMPEVDPRIHMALNCGARGCPAVSVYSSEEASLDAELDQAVAAFVADDGNVRVSRSSGGRVEVACTELFKMYLSDFIGTGVKPGSRQSWVAIVEWILRYAQGPKRELLTASIAQGGEKAKFEWLPYDWRTNGPDLPQKGEIWTPTW